jgi:hypothetical protein
MMPVIKIQPVYKGQFIGLFCSQIHLSLQILEMVDFLGAKCPQRRSHSIPGH